MKRQEDHTPDLPANAEPLSIADLYAIYERDRAEGFPERRPAEPTDEERWLSGDDLTRPDDLVSRPEEVGDTAEMIDRMQRGDLHKAHILRRRRNRPTEGRRIEADDPNLGRVLDAGWVGD